MLAHVRTKARSYRTPRDTWRKLAHVSRQVRQVNYEIQYGYSHPRRLRSQIEHMHDELHEIEDDLHFRREDYYIWR